MAQGPKIRLGQIGKAIHRDDGKIVDNDDVVEGIVLLRKGADADATLDAIHEKVDELNEQHSAARREDRSVPRPQRSVHYTTHTVLHNLTEGIILVAIILFLFLGNVRGALIVALTIPFSLLFASICLNLNHIPANLLSLGALDFGMVVDGAVVMVENIVRHLSHRDRTTAGPSLEPIREAAHEVQRPVFYAIAIIITAYLPIFTLQRVEGRLFKPMAWTVAFALLGALIFSMLIAPVLASFVFRKARRGMAQPGDGLLITTAIARPLRWAIQHRWVDRRRSALAALGAVGVSGCAAASSARNSCRIWMKAPSGRAARSRPAPARPKASRLMNQARVILASFPEVTQVVSPGGPARRRHRHHRLLQHRIFRRPEAERRSGGRCSTRTKTN